MESGRGAPAEVKESDAIVEKRRTANKACSQYVPMRVMREQETGILNMMLPTAQPVPLADMAPGLRLRPIGVAGAGFPSPAQDWEEDAINLAELLRLNRAGSFVFRIDGSSMVDAGIADRDVVVVDRDVTPRSGDIVIAIVAGGFVCYVHGYPHRRGGLYKLLSVGPMREKLSWQAGAHSHILRAELLFP